MGCDSGRSLHTISFCLDRISDGQPLGSAVAAVCDRVSERAADSAPRPRCRTVAWTLFRGLHEISSVPVLHRARCIGDSVPRRTPKVGAFLDRSDQVRRRIRSFDGHCACSDNDLLRSQRPVAQFPILRV